MSGSIVAPPTVAGGGWSFFNNGGGTMTATDQTDGIIDLDTTAAAAAGNAFVRAGSNLATMSVQVGFTMMCDAQIAPASSQQLIAGAQMVERGTAKWLTMNVGFFIHNTANTYTYFLFFLGSNVAAVQSFGNFAPWTQPFLRLRLVGANVVGEVSTNKKKWLSVFSTPILTAFTAAPSGGNPYDVGVGVTAAFGGGTTTTSLFDFAAA